VTLVTATTTTVARYAAITDCICGWLVVLAAGVAVQQDGPVRNAFLCFPRFGWSFILNGYAKHRDACDRSKANKYPDRKSHLRTSAVVDDAMKMGRVA
jgi:hypothetical protein